MGKVQNPAPKRSTDAQERLDTARENYATRAERRPLQTWFESDTDAEIAASKGAEGAVPARMES